MLENTLFEIKEILKQLKRQDTSFKWDCYEIKTIFKKGRI